MRPRSPVPESPSVIASSVGGRTPAGCIAVSGLGEHALQPRLRSGVARRHPRHRLDDDQLQRRAGVTLVPRPLQRGPQVLPVGIQAASLLGGHQRPPRVGPRDVDIAMGPPGRRGLAGCVEPLGGVLPHRGPATGSASRRDRLDPRAVDEPAEQVSTSAPVPDRPSPAMTASAASSVEADPANTASRRNAAPAHARSGGRGSSRSRRASSMPVGGCRRRLPPVSSRKAVVQARRELHRRSAARNARRRASSMASGIPSRRRHTWSAAARSTVLSGAVGRGWRPAGGTTRSHQPARHRPAGGDRQRWHRVDRLARHVQGRPAGRQHRQTRATRQATAGSADRHRRRTCSALSSTMARSRSPMRSQSRSATASQPTDHDTPSTPATAVGTSSPACNGVSSTNHVPSAGRRRPAAASVSRVLPTPLMRVSVTRRCAPCSVATSARPTAWPTKPARSSGRLCRARRSDVGDDRGAGQPAFELVGPRVRPRRPAR